MYKFHRQLLPSSFFNFFTPVGNLHVHNYNTRLASKSSFALPSSRTNYRIFILKFQGPKTWNSIDESLKSWSISGFFLKKTQEFPYQPILNNLFLFLTLTNTLINPVIYIFLRVRVRACVCVPACLTDPIIKPFNQYITTSKPLWFFGHPVP